MPVGKGEPWGSVGPAPAGLVVVESDTALQAVLTACREAGETPPPIGLVGGDLMRALGGTGDAARFGGEVARLTVDAVRVEAAGRTAWFVAHLVARRSWWRGDITGVMNTQYRGLWDVAPRAHPGDARADIVEVTAAMPLSDRIRARRRLALGTHLPHPAIHVRQAATAELSWSRPHTLWLDGRRWLAADALTFVVEPDALVVCV